MMFSLGDDYDGNPVFKPSYKFETDGCDTTQMNALYASIFITCLPGLIIGAIIGTFLTGWLIYGIIYIVGNWFIGCIKGCQSEQAKPNHSERTMARAKQANPSKMQSREAHVAILIDDQPMQRSVSHSSLPPAYPSGDSGSMPPSYTFATHATTTTKELYA